MNTKFDYKELDQEGFETLQAISDANNFNKWMYESISKYTPGTVLEIGSGIGNISKFYLANGQKIYLSDIRESYRNELRLNFSQNTNLAGILDLDIAHPQFNTLYKEYFSYFDSIFSLNVFEHIENDNLALANAKKLLKPGGTLVVLVPAYQALYNQFDKELFHYRRYSASTLEKIFEDNKMKIIKTFYFNSIGIIGWFVSGNLQKNRIIPKNQMEIYNKLTPIFKIVDKLFLNKFGLSVICVGEKEVQ